MDSIYLGFYISSLAFIFFMTIVYYASRETIYVSDYERVKRKYDELRNKVNKK